MKVEIWSDIMCPFCYIGKRKFETALANFQGSEQIEIEWKSFQLDPEMKTETGKSINQYLAERKGWTLEYAKQVNAQVTDMAKEVGLSYDFDKAVVANSFDAHRAIQLAKRNKLGDRMEEALFKAYFTDGKDISDKTVLIDLGVSIGLKKEELEVALFTNQFSDEVEQDIRLAQQIGVRGVPFFVIDRKYAISGAQSPEVFLNALNKVVNEKNEELEKTNTNTNQSCDMNGNCN